MRLYCFFFFFFLSTFVWIKNGIVHSDLVSRTPGRRLQVCVCVCVCARQYTYMCLGNTCVFKKCVWVSVCVCVCVVSMFKSRVAGQLWDPPHHHPTPAKPSQTQNGGTLIWIVRPHLHGNDITGGRCWGWGGNSQMAPRGSPKTWTPGWLDSQPQGWKGWGWGGKRSSYLSPPPHMAEAPTQKTLFSQATEQVSCLKKI